MIMMFALTGAAKLMTMMTLNCLAVPLVRAGSERVDLRIDLKSALLFSKALDEVLEPGFGPCSPSDLPAKPGDSASDAAVAKYETDVTALRKRVAQDQATIMIINSSCSYSVCQVTAECLTAAEIWSTLAKTYQGRGFNLEYSTITELVCLKYEHFNDLEKYKQTFRSLAAKWKQLEAFPTWAERNKAAMTLNRDAITLEQLINEVSDLSRNAQAKSTHKISMMANQKDSAHTQTPAINFIPNLQIRQEGEQAEVVVVVAEVVEDAVVEARVEIQRWHPSISPTLTLTTPWEIMRKMNGSQTQS
ncbi:hypothetical protein VC83_03289 [Pseudogymnoascus destructans]|uniref:Retrotransposon gag domain-containing protein n=1 Tax=Pseudogymnoascus destructans TaxID=655981 RepID=A0A177AGP4_9PEZI|nr:uncharacterized protein VC83_03289 [Pseudogymnoascus destructans]OAF60354.1 hypothetical protein VC83_03289 [Pseudogymnoascus destructans]